MPFVQEQLIGTVDGTNATFHTTKKPEPESLVVKGGGNAVIPQLPLVAFSGSAFDGTGTTVTFQPGYVPKSGPQGPSRLWAEYQSFE